MWKFTLTVWEAYEIGKINCGDTWNEDGGWDAYGMKKVPIACIQEGYSDMSSVITIYPFNSWSLYILLFILISMRIDNS